MRSVSGEGKGKKLTACDLHVDDPLHRGSGGRAGDGRHEGDGGEQEEQRAGQVQSQRQQRRHLPQCALPRIAQREQTLEATAFSLLCLLPVLTSQDYLAEV